MSRFFFFFLKTHHKAQDSGTNWQDANINICSCCIRLSFTIHLFHFPLHFSVCPSVPRSYSRHLLLQCLVLKMSCVQTGFVECNSFEPEARLRTKTTALRFHLGYESPEVVTGNKSDPLIPLVKLCSNLDLIFACFSTFDCYFNCNPLLEQPAVKGIMVAMGARGSEIIQNYWGRWPLGEVRDSYSYWAEMWRVLRCFFLSFFFLVKMTKGDDSFLF